MAIRAMITERLDGWRYQWGDFVEGADSAEIFEGTRETVDEAVQALGESIREKNPAGTLQGDPDGK